MVESKLVHITVFNGDVESVKQLKKELSKIKEKIPDMEFLITNENVEIHDIKHLVSSLYDLYKKFKKDEEKKNE
jgi:hypothetical protein